MSEKKSREGLNDLLRERLRKLNSSEGGTSRKRKLGDISGGNTSVPSIPAKTPKIAESSFKSKYLAKSQDASEGKKAPQKPTLTGLDAYQKIDRLGAGTYGIVYMARDKRDGKYVALKKVRTFGGDNAKKEGFPLTSIREMKILQNLSHINIVKLIEVVRSSVKGLVFLVFEYYGKKIPFSLPFPFSLSFLFLPRRKRLGNSFRPYETSFFRERNKVYYAPTFERHRIFA